MKETEEEIHNRLRAEISSQPNAGQDYIFKLCKAYHQERLNSSLPSEQEIEQLFKNESDCYADTRIDHGSHCTEGEVILAMTEKTFVKVLTTLLTKGEK